MSTTAPTPAPGARPTTWVDGAAGSLFDLDNLPYGVFSLPDEDPRVGVRVGDFVLDLAPAAAGDMLEAAHLFEAGTLNPFLAAGPGTWADVRDWLVEILGSESVRSLVEPALVPLAEVTLHLPFEVADYVDFYCSLDHASNVGRIFRPDAEPLEYLRVGDRAGYDIAVEVVLNGEVVARPPYASMYWSPAQMLAHMTVNGASLRTGDLFASGTISGPERGQRGSLLELSWGGREPFTVAGAERTFLEDGDEVVLRYTAPGAYGPIGLGEVRGTVLPAAG